MCGRYTIGDVRRLSERFDTSNKIEDIKPSYNVAPSQTNPVIDRKSPNQVEMMKWGLIPSWAKDPKIGYKMINARAESVKDKPSFRKPFRDQRCLVPASGFYEWLKTEKEKIPHYIHLKGKELFAFAGLYEIWKDENGNEVKSYTVITTEPNEVMKKIHNRMPVILKEEDEDKWLRNDTDETVLVELLKPYPDEDMEAYPVSRDVNNPRNNSEDLINKDNTNYDIKFEKAWKKIEKVTK